MISAVFNWWESITQKQVIMGLKAIKYQAESYLFKVYNGFNTPPGLDNISSRTKMESANNFYVPTSIQFKLIVFELNRPHEI